ncbi:hypothetical protein LguiB_031509 [Lonicera macranthoides]
MGVVNIVNFFEDKTILVTGATGFLAKIFVEKILRIQPNVKKLYLLIRTTDAKSAARRLHDEIIEKDLFKVLRENFEENGNSYIFKKLIPVSGDISYNNLRIKDSELLQEMWREIDIIVNSAATTNFDERYDVAMGINTFGAMHVVNFAKRCAKLQLLLHVSTAFVCGQREGLILEKPIKMGESLNGALGLDVDAEKKLVEETLNDLLSKEATQEAITTTLMDLGIQRARKYGWPNTYVFTKAMGEMLLGHLKGRLPIVIIRPTIITSTIKEPFPGWVEGFRTIDSITVAYGKGKLTFFLGDLGSIIDTIPGDMVVNSMIVAMVINSNNPNCHMIYHVGSSLRNPLCYGNVKDFCYRYYTKYPLSDKDGRPLKVVEGTVLSSMARFRLYMAIRYMLPLKVLQLVNMILCGRLQNNCYNSKRKINLAMRLGELYESYVFFRGVFDDTNIEKLQTVAKESNVEEDVFYFDPKSFDWEDYFMNIHLPGVVRYVVK